nr:MAG TPA_asm: hypothetical protein [Caudoviricetes sp.]
MPRLSEKIVVVFYSLSVNMEGGTYVIRLTLENLTIK